MEARAIIREDGTAEEAGVTGLVPWWSFTKTALATALMVLWEKDRVDLDRAVRDKPYTAAQLLRHEAGLPDYGSLQRYHEDVEAGRPPWPVAVLFEAVQANRLRYEPGHGWAYSNIGYWVVSRLIEEASDRPLAEALADLVFKPAGLSTARLAVTPADLAHVCMGNVAGYDPGWVYHGLIVGTVMDAARLLHCLLQRRLVERRTLTRMLQCRPLPEFSSAFHPDPGYGLGLMMRAANPLAYPIGHSGNGPGSKMAAYGRRGTTCAIWAATTTGIDPEWEVLSSLWRGASNTFEPDRRV